MKVYFFFYLSLLIIFSASAQKLVDNKLVYNLDNLYVDSFELDTYNGLPLFGKYLKNLPRKISNEPFEGLRAYQAYFSMVELKYLSDLFDKRNKRIFLEEPNDLATASEKGFLSTLTSTFIADLGYKMQNQQWHKKYGTFWDGSINRGPNFDINKNVSNYNNFLNDNLSYLRKFSNRFWKNDFQLAYFVEKIEVWKDYDLNNKGYKIPNLDSHKKYDDWRGMFHKGYTKLVAFDFNTINSLYSYSNIRYISNKDIAFSNTVFFPFAETERELLKNKRVRHLYLVYRIKLSYLDRDIVVGSYNCLNFQYQLESPIVTIYEDKELTKQLGEVSLN